VVSHAGKVTQKPLQQGGFSDTADIKLFSMLFALSTVFLLPKGSLFQAAGPHSLPLSSGPQAPRYFFPSLFTDVPFSFCF